MTNMTEATPLATVTHAVAGSSNIAELAWAREVLYIKFHKSGWYAYPGASERDYEALRDADSVGGHFHANIKKAFVAQKLSTPDLHLST